jgi:hypothetical protein
MSIAGSTRLLGRTRGPADAAARRAYDAPMPRCGRRRCAALLLALVALPASGGDRDPAGVPPAGTAPYPPSVDPPQREIDRAIDRGVAYLRSEQDGFGGFGTTAGETGLALWALRHCGVAKDHPAALRAAERLERDIPEPSNYATSLGICGLLAHDLPKHRERVQKAADFLVRGQCENGQWSYLSKGARRNGGDNSNTQCVALALGAAKLRGVHVPPDTMLRIVEFAARTQNEDGGWGYSEKQAAASYGSMTAGVLMSWVLGSASLSGTDPRKVSFLEEREAKRALEWLARSFDAESNPGNEKSSDNWNVYWLWSVERAGVLGRFDRVGRHDWYAEGAKWLLRKQTEKGAWTDERTIADTCWALLFLRRGTLSVITPGEGERGAETK